MTGRSSAKEEPMDQPHPPPNWLAILIALTVLVGCTRTETGAPSTPSGPSDPSGEADGPRTPTSAPAQGTPTTTPDNDDDTTMRFLGFTAPKPTSWRHYPPESGMRAANYVLPADSGASQAQVVVFQGIGGGVEANITRWVGQFRDANGDPVTAIRESFEVDGVPVHFVELSGQYQGMGVAWPTPNQLFLGAVIEADDGDIQIRLVGPRETVEKHRDAFRTMLEGLRR